jgi:hypothetical protein
MTATPSINNTEPGVPAGSTFAVSDTLWPSIDDVGETLVIVVEVLVGCAIRFWLLRKTVKTARTKTVRQRMEMGCRFIDLNMGDRLRHSWATRKSIITERKYH